MSSSNLTPKPVPPARTAAKAGDKEYVPDWDPGRGTLSEQPPQVVPVLQRRVDVGAPVQVEGITIKPARLMDPAEARNTMARIINDMLVWVQDFPYELTGEEAHVLHAFQEIADRRKARVQARLHDQTIESDAIDRARHEAVQPDRPESPAEG